MTYREKEYILNTLSRIRADTKENNKLLAENNKMLKQIISVLNYYLANANKENEHDFGRNVLANLISSTIDINRLFKRR